MFAGTSVGIVIFRLFRKIEGSVGSGVVAHASHVHPVSVIAAGVVVDQKLLEMPGTGLLILPQIVNQVGSYVYSRLLIHPVRASSIMLALTKSSAVRPSFHFSRVRGSPRLPVDSPGLIPPDRKILEP